MVLVLTNRRARGETRWLGMAHEDGLWAANVLTLQGYTPLPSVVAVVLATKWQRRQRLVADGFRYIPAAEITVRLSIHSCKSDGRYRICFPTFT